MADLLPDSICLIILRQLKPDEITAMASVCRRFARLVEDRSLWRKIDLSVIPNLTIRMIKKLLRTVYAGHIECLRIEGYLKRFQFSGVSGRRRIVTVSLLQDLHERCPSLVELHINNANLSEPEFRLEQFPKSLRFLGLDGSIISYDFFAPLANASVLPQLQGLNLSYCHNFSSLSKTSVPAVFSRHNLKALYLTHCYKLSAEHLNRLPSELPHLETLFVSDISQISDEFLANVAAHCDSLQSLDVSFNRITDEGIRALCDEKFLCCKTLEKLYLTQTGITNCALAYLENCKSSLRELSVVKTLCSPTGIEALSYAMQGKCKIFLRYSVFTAARAAGRGVWLADFD